MDYFHHFLWTIPGVLEEERARTNFIQVEQLMQHNKTLKSQNEAMKRELETIEDTLNEGFRETQILSEKYAALKSKYSRIEKILRTTWFVKNPSWVLIA